MSVKDKYAIVTGGASGIGAAMVQLLCDAGARVVAIDQDGAALAAIADATGCATRTADVSRPIEFDVPLDLAFLNAGISGRPIAEQVGSYRISDLDRSRWDAVSAVNIDGVIHGTHAAAAAMAGRGGGVVVTASVGGLVPWPPDPYYTVTKHAVVGWVRAIADALAGDGITINAICPSVVATAMTGRPDGDDAGGRMLGPGQVAQAAVDASLGTGTGRVITLVAGREPLAVDHEFAAVDGLVLPTVGRSGELGGSS